MTDAEMIESSRSIVLAIEAVADRHHLDGNDRVSLAAMALSELLAQWLGPVGAIERLRDVADTLESQFIPR